MGEKQQKRMSIPPSMHPYSVVHLGGALVLERQRSVLVVVREAAQVLGALRDVVGPALVLVDVHGEVPAALLDATLAGAVRRALGRLPVPVGLVLGRPAPTLLNVPERRNPEGAPKGGGAGAPVFTGGLEEN